MPEFNKEYHCWLDGEYLGIATFTDDENIGPAFLSMAVSTDGELVFEVYNPNIWILLK